MVLLTKGVGTPNTIILPPQMCHQVRVPRKNQKNFAGFALRRRSTFSSRWLPPKVTKVWQDVHEFERIGLVMEHFLRDGGFTNLETWSMRGLPRPLDDKYADRIAQSDPVYAVWDERVPWTASIPGVALQDLAGCIDALSERREIERALQ